jgi:hypothetical protein
VTLAPVLQASPSIHLLGFAATIAVVLDAVRLVPMRPSSTSIIGIIIGEVVA